MVAKAELLPCPFCGGRPIEATTGHGESAHLWFVTCTGCEAQQEHGSREGVIAAWNRRAVAAWRPMETAPKDGREIIVYRADAGVFTCRWAWMEEFVPKDHNGDPTEDYDESFCWWWSHGAFWLEDELTPTHWQPLPAEPGSASAPPANAVGGAATIKAAFDLLEECTEEFGWLPDAKGPVLSDGDCRIRWETLHALHAALSSPVVGDVAALPQGDSGAGEARTICGEKCNYPACGCEFDAVCEDASPTASMEAGEGKLDKWRDKISHPNNRLLFRRMMEKAGVVVGEDDIASALKKVATLSAPAPSTEALAKAVADVASERRRQVEEEDRKPEFDDLYDMGELSAAASCYLSHGQAWEAHATSGAPINFRWPWHPRHFKPTDHRRNLVKAAALILADIERLDRAALTTPTTGSDDAE